jgi:hypothetical protein
MFIPERGLSMVGPAPRLPFLVPDRLPLICCFRIANDLKTITRRDGIVAGVPVFRLRPKR